MTTEITPELRRAAVAYLKAKDASWAALKVAREADAAVAAAYYGLVGLVNAEDMQDVLHRVKYEAAKQ